MLAEMSTKELVDLYIERKRALGYAYGKSAVNLLYQMAAFLEERRVKGGGEVASRGAVLDWVAYGGSDHPRTAVRRATAVRGFCSFLACRGVACFVLPTELSPRDQTDYVPYIFTKAEIAAIASHLDAMGPSGNSPFRGVTLATMFRTIYGCGLRAGEARRLLLGDVDLDSAILSIRGTKNGESRHVPMSDSLRDSISRYLAEGPPGADDPHRPLFPSPRTGGICGDFYPCKPLKKCFAELGITTREGRTPVAHDLRHTFAVHSLMAAAERGESAHSFLPVLATYLGHKDIASAEYYLHLTGEAQDAVIDKMLAAYGGTIYKELEDEDR